MDPDPTAGLSPTTPPIHGIDSADGSLSYGGLQGFLMDETGDIAGAGVTTDPLGIPDPDPVGPPSSLSITGGASGDIATNGKAWVPESSDPLPQATAEAAGEPDSYYDAAVQAFDSVGQAHDLVDELMQSIYDGQLPPSEDVERAGAEIVDAVHDTSSALELLGKDLSSPDGTVAGNAVEAVVDTLRAADMAYGVDAGQPLAPNLFQHSVDSYEQSSAALADELGRMMDNAVRGELSGEGLGDRIADVYHDRMVVEISDEPDATAAQVGDYIADRLEAVSYDPHTDSIDVGRLAQADFWIDAAVDAVRMVEPPPLSEVITDLRDALDDYAERTARGDERGDSGGRLASAVDAVATAASVVGTTIDVIGVVADRFDMLPDVPHTPGANGPEPHASEDVLDPGALTEGGSERASDSAAAFPAAAPSIWDAQAAADDTSGAGSVWEAGSSASSPSIWDAQAATDDGGTSAGVEDSEASSSLSTWGAPITTGDSGNSGTVGYSGASPSPSAWDTQATSDGNAESVWAWGSSSDPSISDSPATTEDSEGSVWNSEPSPSPSIGDSAAATSDGGDSGSTWDSGSASSPSILDSMSTTEDSSSAGSVWDSEPTSPSIGDDAATIDDDGGSSGSVWDSASSSTPTIWDSGTSLVPSMWDTPATPDDSSGSGSTWDSDSSSSSSSFWDSQDSSSSEGGSGWGSSGPESASTDASGTE